MAKLRKFTTEQRRSLIRDAVNSALAAIQRRRYYKVLTLEMAPASGGTFFPWKVGRNTVRPKLRLRMCVRGLHITSSPGQWKAYSYDRRTFVAKPVWGSRNVVEERGPLRSVLRRHAAFNVRTWDYYDYGPKPTVTSLRRQLVRRVGDKLCCRTVILGKEVTRKFRS